MFVPSNIAWASDKPILTFLLVEVNKKEGERVFARDIGFAGEESKQSKEKRKRPISRQVFRPIVQAIREALLSQKAQKGVCCKNKAQNAIEIGRTSLLWDKSPFLTNRKGKFHFLLKRGAGKTGLECDRFYFSLNEANI
jgi:hypothetical protein